MDQSQELEASIGTGNGTVVHVDEREVCLIQVKATKLPHASLQTDRRYVRCAASAVSVRRQWARLRWARLRRGLLPRRLRLRRLRQLGVPGRVLSILSGANDA